jgi:hypothetical protein
MARALHTARQMPFRPRIAIALPFAPERTSIADWLSSEGFDAKPISHPGLITDELKRRNFEAIVIDASHGAQAINAVRSLQQQTPVIIIGAPDPVAESQAVARGATYLTRPVDRALITCSIAMAVMESRPARRSERKPVRFEVVVQGVPSRIIDVSKEGMRLEIPRLRKAAPPPPVFDVALPMLGVSLNVRRLWASTPPECVGQTIWYGGELSNNTKRAELAWLTLVDALPTSRVSLEVQ